MATECKECKGLKDDLKAKDEYLGKIRHALDAAQERNVQEVMICSRQVTDLRNRIAELTLQLKNR